MNPMLQNLSNNKITQAISKIKSLGNPQMMIQSMPQYKQVMDYVNANGSDPKEAFYKKASEMGINPDDIINQLK